MAGMMTAFVGSGGILTISITAATASNGGTPTYYFYGWNSYPGSLPYRQFIPLATMGSAVGTPIYYKGVNVLGVYSSSVAGTGTATSYLIVLDGNQSLGFVSGLIINGTAITPLSSNLTYDGTATVLYFNVTSAATLFTASSTVGIY